MNIVEPIRDLNKIQAIKRNLRKKKNPRDLLLFIAGINFALRIGDLLRIRVKDVIDDKGEIREFFYIREQKTNRERKIIINNGVKEALERYFDKSGVYEEGRYLFTSAKSKENRPLTRAMAWKLVNRWCREVGIKQRIGTHTLRKTFGYMARTRGAVPIEVIQGILGHKSIKVTTRYIGVSDLELEKASKSFVL